MMSFVCVCEMLEERRKAPALSIGIFVPWLGDQMRNVSFSAWPSKQDRD